MGQDSLDGEGPTGPPLSPSNGLNEALEKQLTRGHRLVPCDEGTSISVSMHVRTHTHIRVLVSSQGSSRMCIGDLNAAACEGVGSQRQG